MSDFRYGAFIGSIVTTIAAIITIAITVEKVENIYKNDAVKHGAATYYLDEKNNKCWKWNNVGRD